MKTYSVGSIFRRNDEHFLLAQVEASMVSLICLTSGNRLVQPIKVDHVYSITYHELKKMRGSNSTPLIELDKSSFVDYLNITKEKDMNLQSDIPRSSETKGVVVHTPNKWLFDAVQQHQFDYYDTGWDCNKKKLIPYDSVCNYINLNVENKKRSLKKGSSYDKEYYIVLTADEYFANHEKYCNHKLMVGEREVHDMNKDGFIVGCEDVTWGEFNAILTQKIRRGF